WELDYYLHENPELKRAAYVWLTDFVGWLPMQDGGARETYLTADYNAEMIEHIARYGRVRDQALFVGNPDDILADRFGPDITANRRPFLYFPLRHHFEQNFHVRHRLERYGAGRCMDFELDGPEEVAAAIAEEIGTEVDYRPVESDGAARAAAAIAELL